VLDTFLLIINSWLLSSAHFVAILIIPVLIVLCCDVQYADLFLQTNQDQCFYQYVHMYLNLPGSREISAPHTYILYWTLYVIIIIKDLVQDI